MKCVKWEPSSSSVICARHFKPDDFMTRYVRPQAAPGEQQAFLVKPRLKTDGFGICVCPSIQFSNQEDQTLTARDSPHIVSNYLCFIVLFTFYRFIIIRI